MWISFSLSSFFPSYFHSLSQPKVQTNFGENLLSFLNLLNLRSSLYSLYGRPTHVRSYVQKIRGSISWSRQVRPWLSSFLGRYNVSGWPPQKTVLLYYLQSITNTVPAAWNCCCIAAGLCMNITICFIVQLTAAKSSPSSGLTARLTALSSTRSTLLPRSTNTVPSSTQL